MPEVYATGSDGKKYRTRADYEAGRFQSMGTNAAQKESTRKSVVGLFNYGQGNKHN